MPAGPVTDTTVPRPDVIAVSRIFTSRLSSGARPRSARRVRRCALPGLSVVRIRFSSTNIKMRHIAYVVF